MYLFKPTNIISNNFGQNKAETVLKDLRNASSFPSWFVFKSLRESLKILRESQTPTSSFKVLLCFFLHLSLELSLNKHNPRILSLFLLLLIVLVKQAWQKLFTKCFMGRLFNKVLLETKKGKGFQSPFSDESRLTSLRLNPNQYILYLWLACLSFQLHMEVWLCIDEFLLASLVRIAEKEREK